MPDEVDWQQRALEAEQALGIERTENAVLRSELERIYRDHFSGPNCRCRECRNRIKDLLNIREA